MGYVVAPLTLLPATAADYTAAILSLIAFVAALWVVGVRDWRVYGASFLWPSVLGEVRTAHLTLVLCLLLAVVWRTRDRFPFAGLTLGVALALKFFLWPLVIWLAALRRWRDAALAAGFAAVTLLLVLPFISLPEYARLLRRLGQTFDQDSYTPFGLALPAGRVGSRRAGHHDRSRRRRPRDRLAPAELRPLRRRGVDAVADRLARLLRRARRAARGRPAAAVGDLAAAPPDLGHDVGRLRHRARRRRRCARSSVFGVLTVLVARAERRPDEIRGPSPVRREAVQVT